MFEERLDKPSIKPPPDDEAAPESQGSEEQHPSTPLGEAPDSGRPSGDQLILAFTHEEACWVKTLIDYLEKGDLPKDEAEAECVSRQAKTYSVVDDKLF